MQIAQCGHGGIQEQTQIPCHLAGKLLLQGITIQEIVKKCRAGEIVDWTDTYDGLIRRLLRPSELFSKDAE
jgi:hypothetical protein